MARRSLVALGAAVAVALGACSSSAPTAPPLSDPTEILTRALDAAQAARSVHYKADASGTIALDLMGIGSGTEVDLTGATVEGDVDIAGGKATAAFKAPSLFGLSGDAIVVGTDAYLRVGLLGDRYQKSSGAGAGGFAALGDPKKTMADLKAALAGLSAPPVRAPDEKCGDRECYRVTVSVPNLDVGGALMGMLGGALGGAFPSPGGASAAPSLSGSGTVDVWVSRTDLRPARLAIEADGGSQGKLAVAIELTGWDATVSISAPPADKVAPSP